MQEVNHLCTHAAELRRCGRIGSVWLSERISIPASLASYVQGTGEGSPGPGRPKLARAPPPLPPRRGMECTLEGLSESDYVVELTEVGWR